MRFPQQEHWIRLPFPSPGDILNPAIESGSPELQADSLLSEPQGKTYHLLRGSEILGYFCGFFLTLEWLKNIL